MGALFWKPVVWRRSPNLRVGRKIRLSLVGASAQAAVDYREANYSRPLILLLGSEQKGLSPEQIAIGDQTVRLPMLGRVSSLNRMAAAGFVVLKSSTITTPRTAGRGS